jgi:type VII secretion integral membrane protein EccD
MSASDQGLRRVSIHAGSAVVDLALPTAIPIATLIPSIVDILEHRGPDGCGKPARYQLSRPGASALPKSTTLAQNNIQDGAVLVLSESSPAPPVARHHDLAEAVADALETANRHRTPRTRRLTAGSAAICVTCIGALTVVRNELHTGVPRFDTAVAAAVAGIAALLFAVIAHRAYRDPLAGVTLSLIGTVFAAVTGFLAVPGPPGLPHVLLTATAVAVAAVLAMRLTGGGVVTLTAVACAAMVVAVAALTGVLTSAAPHAVGSMTAAVSLVLLGGSARAAIVLAGLSPHLTFGRDVADRVGAQAVRARGWLMSLLAGFSCCAAAGAIVTALTGTPRWSCLGFAAVVGALLLLRARGDDGGAMVFAVSGIITSATTFAVAAAESADHGPWLVAMTAVLAAAAGYLGFVAPAISPSPIARRGMELLEYLALVSMVPLTCWICGAYHAVRGFTPT